MNINIDYMRVFTIILNISLWILIIYFIVKCVRFIKNKK